MDDENKQNKKQKLIRKMKKQRGYMPSEWVYMVDKDVDFMEVYNNLYENGLTDGKALATKTRELIAIAILAFRGQENAVYLHAKRALRHGATKQELLEAIETTIIQGGVPTFGVGLSALMRIEEEEKKVGKLKEKGNIRTKRT
jgi:AhpD family alkylhydroperoxidase